MRRLLPWLTLLSLGCSDLTMPTSDGASARINTRAPEPATPEPVEAAPAKARKARKVEPDQDRISASHVLVAFKGSRRSKADITRTKQEAKQRADEVRAKALKGEDFTALAREYSDDSSAGKGGDLGSFGRTSMVKPFADAAFSLKPGGVSDVVETEFGFHVIQRTK
jgi:parvulin-like peptidyl-prolyl isomerase